MSESTRAGTSCRLGLLSFVLTFLTGIPAIVLGWRGLREIRRSNGGLQGRRAAWVGIGTGTLGSMLGGALLWFAIDRVLDAFARTE
jgi:hypothetical protein